MLFLNEIMVGSIALWKQSAAPIVHDPVRSKPAPKSKSAVAKKTKTATSAPQKTAAKVAPKTRSKQKSKTVSVPKTKSFKQKGLSDFDKALEMLYDRYANASEESRSLTFYQRVYAIVEQIPKGKVTTYGAIAETLGMKRSSRMVGQALNAVTEGLDIPAQRVINRIGALTGAHHFGGYERMRKLLEKEGVTFKKELVDMQKHFWHPQTLLSGKETADLLTA